MTGMISLCLLLWTSTYYVLGSGDGNIHLLKEEVATALQSCSFNERENQNDNYKRQRRNENLKDISPRIDANARKEVNPYNHERRSVNFSDQMDVINGSDLNHLDENKKNAGPLAVHYSYNKTNERSARVKRNKPFLINDDDDQCLSQCVFANLEVVDSHGIPREAELWNQIQSAVTSQQSRTLLKDQIRSCFQELESESEDNGCSYSNKLERCLMLRFSDRKKEMNKKTSQI